MPRYQRAQNALITTQVRSYSERVGQSSTGALLGIALVGGSAFLLWWNEHRAVEQQQSLGEMKNQVVEASQARVNPKDEGKWVHVTGPVVSDEFVHDDEYNIPSSASSAPPVPSAPPLPTPSALPAFPSSNTPLINPSFSSQPPAYEDVVRGVDDFKRSPYIRLRRETQMYQWLEESQQSVNNKTGGKQEVKTTTTYKKDWSSVHQDSARFRMQEGHENPPSIPTSSNSFQPDAVSVGDFLVSGEITRALEEKNVTPSTLEINGQVVRRVGEWIYVTASSNRPPQIGDVRVRFFAAPQGEVMSVVGRQRNGWLVAPSDHIGQNSASASPLCRPGHWTAAEILESASQQEQLVTSLLRLVGIIGSIASFRMFLDPVVTVGAVVPLVSSILGAGATALSIPVGLGFALPTVLAGWLHARCNYSVLRGVTKSLYITYLVIFLIKLGKYLAKAASATGNAGLKSVRQAGTWWQALWAMLRR